MLLWYFELAKQEPFSKVEVRGVPLKLWARAAANSRLTMCSLFFILISAVSMSTALFIWIWILSFRALFSFSFFFSKNFLKRECHIYTFAIKSVLIIHVIIPMLFSQHKTNKKLKVDNVIFRGSLFLFIDERLPEGLWSCGLKLYSFLTLISVTVA